MKLTVLLETTAVAIALVLSPLAHAAEDILIADFEGADYGAWKVTGEAFGPGPAKGALPGQMAVEGFQGKGLVNSFFKGDDTTGSLTSPTFKIERGYINFLIGGGGTAGMTCVNLLIDGTVVRTATGPNSVPGGTERLEGQGWDVKEFAGKEASIQILDDAKGSWGHVNVDQIVQSDTKVAGLLVDATREITLEKRFLNLPVKNGAPMKRVNLSIAGQAPREFDIELADGAPDWWAFIDVSAQQGSKAVIRVNKLREDSAGLRSIEQTDAIKGGENLYQEKLRPQFHFSSRRGWNNDPNGLVFYKGEYHLFYQHNPYGWNWGNMHWGHAVSPDMIHWKELPIALFPDPQGTMFSGSAVVDWNNTAGFQKGEEKVLVCIYTAAGSPFTQGLAHSNDRGRTWTKYEKNPVLGNLADGNRDPKVIWYAPEKKWLMALYLDKSDFGLFASPDLKKWDRLSTITLEGTNECPEFFEILVQGRAGETKWVFYGGNGRYLVGKFDGKSFTSESGPFPMHFGNGWYASQTFTDIPKEDGRRILVPWATIASPGMPFNQMMGIPVELELRGTAEGMRLAANPIRELESLRKPLRSSRAQVLKPGDNPLEGIKGELLDIITEIEIGKATELNFTLRGIPVRYDVAGAKITCHDQSAPLRPVDGKLHLRMLVDRTSIELFGNHGLVYLTAGVVLPSDNLSMGLEVKGGEATMHKLDVFQLESAWKQE